MPEAVLLDSSALLTLIEDEPGADRVEEVLLTKPCLIPWLVLLEVHYITQRERGEEEAEWRHAFLVNLPAEILWEADRVILRVAASFKANHRLSLADAVIAGFAQTRNAVLLHKDPEFEALADHLALENLPFKPSGQ